MVHLLGIGWPWDIGEWVCLSAVKMGLVNGTGIGKITGNSW